jgi:hypothetical protein
MKTMIAPEVENASLEWLWKSSGRDAVAELDKHIDAYTRRIAMRCDVVRGIELRTVAPLVEEVRRIGEWCTLRRSYEDRRNRLRVLGGEGKPKSSRPPRPVAEEVRDLVVEARGDESLDAFRRYVASLEAAYVAMLAEAEAQPARWAGVTLNPSQGSIPFSQDEILDKVRAAIATCREIQVRRARIAGDRTAMRLSQAEDVARAIEAAGGPEAVASGMRESRLIRKLWYEQSPSFDALAAAEGRRAKLQGELRLLNVSAEDAAALPEHSHSRGIAIELRDDAVPEATAIRKRIDDAMGADVAELVRMAMEGGEGAREIIERDVRALPTAFASDLAESLNHAQAELSAVGCLAVAMMLDPFNAAL